MAKNHPTYTDEFRASAVAMLHAAGYPKAIGALRAVSRKLKVPERTLSRWFNAEQNPPPDKLVSVKKGDMADALEEVAWTLLDSMSDADAIGDASLQQRATAYAIAIDKMRLLRGLPTEIVALIPDVISAIQSLGQSPAEVFQRMIELAAKQRAERERNSLPRAGTG
jgi:hypothetical protein